MKSFYTFLLLISLGMFLFSCEKIKNVFEKEDPNELNGEQSEIGKVGTTISTTSMEIEGVSNLNASVTALESGISKISGSAVCTNDKIKAILANFPEVKINGNNVTLDDVQMKIATDGIESVHGLAPGIIVKYDAEVGDTYPISTGGERKVVSRSTDDDYGYGFMLIKVIEVEEPHNKMGVKNIRYFANHKFGMVGMEFTFDDNSTVKFPVYSSAENK